MAILGDAPGYVSYPLYYVSNINNSSTLDIDHIDKFIENTDALINAADESIDRNNIRALGNGKIRSWAQRPRRSRSIFDEYVRPISPKSNSVPAENIRVDFPIDPNTTLSKNDISEIESWIDNGIHTYALSYVHYPETAFYTRYEDGLKLNRSGGPAVIYKNGNIQYWVRGKRVPDDLIRKLFDDKIDGISILLISNIEDRRTAIECIGSEEFSKRLTSVLEIVDISILNKRRYTLYITGYNAIADRVGRAKASTITPVYFLKVMDASTDREYYLQVPPSNDAIESLAWTFGMTKEEYLPMLET